MNWDQIQGKWKQVKGDARRHWGKLTDDDFEKIAGDRDKLSGKIQSAYGWSKEEADREIDKWSRTVH